jgi:uncharacterized protein (TIGR02996 family)
MTHDEAFLQAIRDDPDSDAPRLIYADWLEDHGQEARAEFIRAQCERVRPDTEGGRAAALEARAAKLLSDHWTAWVGPLRAIVGQGGDRLGEAWMYGTYHPAGLSRFRRGFVEDITLRTGSFLTHAAALFRLTPVRRLRLWGAGPRAAQLAASPYLAEVGALEFVDYYSEPLTAEGARSLAGSPHLGRLRALSLYRNNVGDEGLRALAGAPWLANVRSLNLVDNGLSAEGARALAGPDRAASLAVLLLANNSLGDEGLRALAASPLLPRLVELDLARCGVTDQGVGVLAAAPGPGRLATLTLDHNSLGEMGATRLAAAPLLAGLTSLNVNHCALGDGGAEALARSPHLADLTTLGVGHNGLTARGEGAVRALPRLRRVHLWGNPCRGGVFADGGGGGP